MLIQTTSVVYPFNCSGSTVVNLTLCETFYNLLWRIGQKEETKKPHNSEGKYLKYSVDR